jgi:hypothetical protein
MKLLKKLPLVRIAACILMISIVTSMAMFSGTYAWFVGGMEDKTVSGAINGEMGKVAVSIGDNGQIINDSTIPIIVRVRVIAEVDSGNVLPTEMPNVNVTSSGWSKVESQNGIFFVYGGNAPKGVEDYTEVPVGINLQFTFDKSPNTVVSFIVEALQATENAYKFAWGGGN